ncbi:hypothetical protein L1887_36044 [Cichorium endivia]|nr:hypothetical protein L1887_36044 [Cichorium endivia]
MAATLATTMFNSVKGKPVQGHVYQGKEPPQKIPRDLTERAPSGIPYNIIDLAHGNAHNPGWTGGDSILADSGTEQLEFIALTQKTGDLKYQQKVENVIPELNKTFPADGLLPIYINPHRGTTSHSTITFGAMGDRHADSTKFLNLAEELAWTCYNFYQSTPTNLAGENYFFHSGQDMTVGTSWNILRPETVESLFYLWRLTAPYNAPNYGPHGAGAGGKEGITEAIDRDAAFASSLESFGGGPDPIEHTLSDRLLRFTNIELQDIKEARKRFDKADAVYSQIRDNFLSLRKKYSDRNSCSHGGEPFEELYNARMTFEQARFNLVSTLSSVETKKIFEIVESSSEAMDAHLHYFKEGYELFHQMQPYIQQKGRLLFDVGGSLGSICLGLGLGIFVLSTPGFGRSYPILPSTWMTMRLLHFWLRYQSLSVLQFDTVT